MAEPRPCLHVCTSCRASQPLAEGDTPPGARLHAAIARYIAAHGAPFDLRELVCFQACERGCTASISMPGKWTYLLGGLTEGQIPDLVTYSVAYAASATGTVLPSRRPPSLRTAILARFPSPEKAA
jgi:predicted metal-binding protein